MSVVFPKAQQLGCWGSRERVLLNASGALECHFPFGSEPVKQNKARFFLKKCCFCLHLQGAKMLPQWPQVFPWQVRSKYLQVLSLPYFHFIAMPQPDVCSSWVLLQVSSHWVFFFYLLAIAKEQHLWLVQKYLDEGFERSGCELSDSWQRLLSDWL